MTSLSHIKNLILDADGVLWRGDTPMPGLHEFFDTLRQKNIGFVVATNNATKTSQMYTERFKGYGLDVPPEQVVPSAEATASYLREEYPAGTPIYPVGEKGLHEALLAQEFTVVSEEEALKGAKAELVVVGFNRNATYRLMAMGAHLINQGARFIGTNPDPSFPSERGPLPGAGALLAFIQTGTGVKPTIIGKPGPIMFQQAVKRLGGTLENTAMVGDRLTTDILGANNAGLNSILVLSGVSKPEDVKIQNIEPDFYLCGYQRIDPKIAMTLETSQKLIFRPNHHESGSVLAILLIPISIVAFILFYDFFPPFCLAVFGLVLLLFVFSGFRTIWFYFKSYIEIGSTSISGYDGRKEFEFDWQELVSIQYIDKVLINKTEEEKGHWLIFANQKDQIVLNIDSFDVTAVREALNHFAPHSILEPNAYKNLDAYKIYAQDAEQHLNSMVLPVQVSVGLNHRIIYVLMFLFLISIFCITLVNYFLAGIAFSFLMALIFLYWILQGSGTVEADTQAITFNKLWGKYRILWTEIDFLEMNTNQGWLVFWGNQKLLGIPAPGLWNKQQKDNFELFLDKQIEIHQLEIKKSKKAPFRFNKNVRV